MFTLCVHGYKSRKNNLNNSSKKFQSLFTNEKKTRNKISRNSCTDYKIFNGNSYITIVHYTIDGFLLPYVSTRRYFARPSTKRNSLSSRCISRLVAIPTAITFTNSLVFFPFSTALYLYHFPS